MGWEIRFILLIYLSCQESLVISSLLTRKHKNY